MQLIKKVERGSVPSLRQADGFRFRKRHRRLTARLLGLGWSSTGQRSSCGASTRSDAAIPLSSCPKAALRCARMAIDYDTRIALAAGPVQLRVELFSRNCGKTSMAESESWLGRNGPQRIQRRLERGHLIFRQDQ